MLALVASGALTFSASIGPAVLAMVDPAALAIRETSRPAEAAVAPSSERSWHLGVLTRSFVLDGALFGATSYRWDPAVSVHDAGLGAGVLGGGLRLAPTRAYRSAARVDISYPVVRTAGVRARPLVAVSIVAPITTNRQRDGRRLP